LSRLRDAHRGASPAGITPTEPLPYRFTSQLQVPFVCKTDEPRGGDGAGRVGLPVQALQFSFQMWMRGPQVVDLLLVAGKLSPHREFGRFERQTTPFIEFQQSCTRVHFSGSLHDRFRWSFQLNVRNLISSHHKLSIFWGESVRLPPIWG